MEKRSTLKWIDPSSYLLTNRGIVQAINIKENDIIKTPDNKIQKVLQKNKEKKEGFLLKLKNGNSFFISQNQMLETCDGFILSKELKETDFLKIKLVPPFFLKSNKYINFNNVINTNATPIYTPEYMSKDLALWLGIMAVKGRYNRSNGIVGVEVFDKDKEFEELFVLLTKYLFNITPEKVGKRRKFLQIYSQNICRFLQQTIGMKSYLKKMPSIIAEASFQEQFNFLRGVNFKGYYDGKYWVIYSGASKALRDFLGQLLTQYGYIVRLKTTNSSSGNKVYYLTITGKFRDRDNLWNLDLQENMMIKVPLDIKKVKVSKNNKNYESFRKIKRYDKKIAKGEIIRNIGLEFPQDEYYLKIESILHKERTAIGLETLYPITASGINIS